MHYIVTSKNVKWCHLIWPILYIYDRETALFHALRLTEFTQICVLKSSHDLWQTKTRCSCGRGTM